MSRATRFSPEVRERAVRMVGEQTPAHPSQWAAIRSIAEKMGCSPETLRSWIRRHERDTGQRPGLTTADVERLKQLERENKELRRANEILRKASAFFAAAELDRRPS
jgi:transposase